MRNFKRFGRFSHKDLRQLSKDVKRAFSRAVDERAEHESTRPPRFQLGPVVLTESSDLVLIPRVPNAGFKLGRLTFVVTSDLAQGSANNKWTVKISRYRDLNGRPKETQLGSFTTRSFGIDAYDPYEYELDEVLFEGDVLVVRFVETGFGGIIHGLTVQVDERYGS
jgi:hypothetical protein